MAKLWKCTECGKVAEYKDGKINYCDEHWVEHIGIPKRKKVMRKAEKDLDEAICEWEKIVKAEVERDRAVMVWVGLIVGGLLGIIYLLCV